MLMKTEIHGTKQVGPYIIRDETVESPDGIKAHDLRWKMAYSEMGLFIGPSREAWRYWKRYGIERFYNASGSGTTANVGWSPTKKKWFGWSHRAIYGFKTKKQAVRFARSVS